MISAVTARTDPAMRPALFARQNYTEHLRATRDTLAELVAKTGTARTTPCRHLPPRPAQALTASGVPGVPEREE